MPTSRTEQQGCYPDQVRYGITRIASDGAPFLPISAEEFRNIKFALQNILVLLGVEEKFDAFLQNYVDYERELMSLALGHAVFRSWDWSTLTGDLQLINRRLANVLTSARAYIDSIEHDLEELLRAEEPENNTGSGCISERIRQFTWISSDGSS